MICKRCKATNEETYNFCNKCGTRLEAPKSELVQGESSSDEKHPSILDLGNIQNGKLYLAFGVVFLVFLGMAFLNTSSPRRTTNEPAASESSFVIPSDVLSEDEILDLAKSLCTSVNDALASEIDVKQLLADVKQNSSSVGAATKDAWASNAWKEKNPSWFSGESYSDQVDTNIRATISSNSERLVKPLLTAEEFQRYERSREKWTWYMFQPVVYGCGLTKTVETLSAFDSKLKTIASQADNIPWHPKGFSEIPGYPGFAIGKANGSCSYSFGSCAIFNIISQTACPSSLYVEANGLNGDVVTSWGNDTARVAAGQVARIEISFSEDVDTWEFTNVNCY